jgi:hypothetical protein
MDQERLFGREVAIGQPLEGSGSGVPGPRGLERSQVRDAPLGLSWQN